MMNEQRMMPAKVASEEAPVKERRQYVAGEFEGPLDLLWALIHEQKIDIYDIPIVQITEQFLEYLDFAESVNLGDLSEFYNMAAKLIYIKSKTMLPYEKSASDDDDYEDPRDELVERLIEYHKFKKLSYLMEEKEDENEWDFERKKIKRIVPVEQDDVWKRIDTWDLLEQMQKMFKNLMSAYTDSKILDMYEEISVNEKITLINEFLDEKGECLFTDLITRAGSELDIICAFMAVLEAVKFKMAVIYQHSSFGDIKICRSRAA